MSLLSRLREKQAGKLATATPATLATQAGEWGRTVASVATVAVASPEKSIPESFSASPALVVTDDTKTASYWWLLHYADREPVEVGHCPDLTHAEVLERYPDAVAAEPFTLPIRKPMAPMTVCEEATVRAWLALIEETDPAIIAKVIGQCQQDVDAREYFMGQAVAQLPKPLSLSDDRRTCNQCANLINEQCQAAKRGEIVAARIYRPVPDLLRRCEAFAPLPGDPERQTGRERW